MRKNVLKGLMNSLVISFWQLLLYAMNVKIVCWLIVRYVNNVCQQVHNAHIFVSHFHSLLFHQWYDAYIFKCNENDLLISPHPDISKYRCLKSNISNGLQGHDQLCFRHGVCYSCVSQWKYASSDNENVLQAFSPYRKYVYLSGLRITT